MYHLCQNFKKDIFLDRQTSWNDIRILKLEGFSIIKYLTSTPDPSSSDITIKQIFTVAKKSLTCPHTTPLKICRNVTGEIRTSRILIS